MTHLDALQLRLFNERGYLAKAKTEGERELRRVWIAQIEKEIVGEREFIAKQDDISDDELLAELMT